MTKPPFEIAAEGDQPLIATAIHAGHDVRDEVAALFAISDTGRLREEDPYTDTWTPISGNRIVGNRSRFEVDLNRPREKAVYIKPEDAWGLTVWKREPDREMVDRSLALFDSFCAGMGDVLEGLVSRFGYFVVLDLHSYNHRRRGMDNRTFAPRVNARGAS